MRGNTAILSSSISIIILLVAAFCLIIFTVLLVGLGLIHQKDNIRKQKVIDEFKVKSILVQGSKIQYLEKKGEGPVVALFHGFGSSHRAWHELIRLTSNSRVIAFDVIGFGGSDKPNISYDLSTIANYMSQALKTLGVKQVFLVGFSMGASVSVAVAANNPELVEELILISPSGFPGSLKFSFPRRILYRPGAINTFAKNIVAFEIFEKMFPNNIARQILGVTGSYDDEYAVSLNKIEQVTILLWSEGDERVPLEYSKEYLSRIPNSQLIVLPEEVGHELYRAIPIISRVLSNQFLAE